MDTTSVIRKQNKQIKMLNKLKNAEKNMNQGKKIKSNNKVQKKNYTVLVLITNDQIS